MTKPSAILTLLLAAGGLAACAGAGETGTGAYMCTLSCGYAGRFDNDENRRPMLVDNGARMPAPQTLTYGGGEH